MPLCSYPVAKLPTLALPAAAHDSAWMSERAEQLREALGAEFLVLDIETEAVTQPAAYAPRWAMSELVALCREVARRGQAEIVADEDALLLLAVPLQEASPEARLVAVGGFLTRAAEASDDLAPAAARLGVDLPLLQRWAATQPIWPTRGLLQIARLLQEKWSDQAQNQKLAAEVEQISSHLLTTYEEITLLHRLTQNLKISRSETQLGQLAIDWLADVLPVKGLAIMLQATGDAAVSESRPESQLLTHGDCGLEAHQFNELIERLGDAALARPLVLNHLERSGAEWPYPQIESLIVAPLAESEKIFGWIIAFNHCDGMEFGTVEASLLGSAGAILGIHSGNLDLYRQQAEFLSSVVRALTSAIDAKDPYTCGHSDRVARVSVRLAEELGCDAATRDTLYLSGLLHDIGKIGIDDNVLRKPGKLTDAEYEHIKLHPELGYKILRDLKQLDQILPVVLHHHEAWDGGGYPHGLAGESIPLLARIVAVADSFDAMSSDRPYRKGMPQEKLEAILRAGAGKQWDARVIDAFMRAREDILTMTDGERESLRLTAQQWS